MHAAPIAPIRTRTTAMRHTTRLARLALPLAILSAFAWRAAELKGTYKIEITVQDQSYGGSGEITPDGKGAFTGKFLFTAPIEVTYDMNGTQKGDSVHFEAKYNDKSNGCVGTMKGSGTAKSDGSGASGPVSIEDSCRGTIDATYRLAR
jgi:hypothetical protein